MPLNYEYSFEVRPGKPVFIQRADALGRGQALTASIEAVYKPSDLFFHFRRRGGHVGAMKRHLQSAYFSRFDLRDFFDHVTRGKVVRSLKKIGWSNKGAFSAAYDSVVVRDGRAILPFGFHQSPLLATLVLEHSLLGVYLQELSRLGCVVSVYMDDILLSSNDRAKLEEWSATLITVASEAGFPVSEQKIAVALDQADIFNCSVSQGSVRFLDHRMRKFLEDHDEGSGAAKAAIERYILAVSADEHEEFLRRLGEPLDAEGLGVNVRRFAEGNG